MRVVKRFVPAKVEAKLPHTIQRGGSFCLSSFQGQWICVGSFPLNGVEFLSLVKTERDEETRR